MNLRTGSKVWLPCDVRPGPFSNERLVRVESEGVEWVGFVPVSALRDPCTERGSTYVEAIVVEINGDAYRAALPGESVTSSLFTGSLSKVEPLAAVPA